LLSLSSRFQRVSRLGFVTAPTSLNGGEPNFARCLAVSWAGILYVHFRGLLLPNGIMPGAKFTFRPSLAFSYIGSVTARRSSSGPLSQNLRRRTTNGIAELSLLVIFAVESESPVTEFRMQLEYSLQLDKLKQTCLATSLSNHRPNYQPSSCSC